VKSVQTIAVAAIVILPIALVIAAAPQDQPPGAVSPMQGGPRQALPGPGEDLPFNDSELQRAPEQYQGQEPFCGDDVVSKIICKPATQYTSQKAAVMCQSFREQHLPNFKIGLSWGFASVDITSMQEYCDHFFPLVGILCRSDSVTCELQSPAPVGSDCDCYTVQFGLVPGKAYDPVHPNETR
jgi:hypothetical protein